MDNSDFDRLLKAYRQAVNQWVDAIRAEEALANEEHSIVQMELWDDAEFKVQEAQKVAKQARDAYQGVLREKNYGF